MYRLFFFFSFFLRRKISINPLNVALNVGQTVTSMVQAGFASRRKVKLVLDESKPLSFYSMCTTLSNTACYLSLLL